MLVRLKESRFQRLMVKRKLLSTNGFMSAKVDRECRLKEKKFTPLDLNARQSGQMGAIHEKISD